MNSIKARRVCWKKQRGQSLVEMALITPILLITLYVPADFGVAFLMGNLTQNAARDGARVGSGLQKTGGNSYSSVEATTVRNQVMNQLPAFLTNKSVGIKFYSGTACMEFIEVTAQGQYNFFLYQLIKLFGGSVPDSVIISRTTQMRYNYQPVNNQTPCSAATNL